MPHTIIDRRKNDKNKSSVNRSRYMRRVRESIRDSVRDIIRDGSVGDALDGKDKKVKIKSKNLNQPDFHHDPNGGIKDHIYPGNKEFVVGDKIKRPKDGRGKDGGDDPSDSGEGEDDFSFTISQKEFLDIFFEDLELPDLVKKDMATTVEYVMKRAGFTVDGNPSRLNIIRSMKQSMSRTLALIYDEEEELKECEKQLKLMSLSDPRREPLEKRIEKLKEIIKAVPFMDDMDLRYNRWDKAPIPSTQAVMFGIMDVSGSMGEWEKEMAKRFFILMMMFLKRKYEKVEIVWIRHTTDAKEVDEEEFFLSRESGGTIVSTSYDLMSKIQKERYPTSSWNIFGVQISDGDNFENDIPLCVNFMKNTILPVCQYFAYVETRQRENALRTVAKMFGISLEKTDSDLYSMYKRELSDKENFALSVITDSVDIYPVFRKLFEKKENE